MLAYVKCIHTYNKTKEMLSPNAVIYYSVAAHTFLTRFGFELPSVVYIAMDGIVHFMLSWMQRHNRTNKLKKKDAAIGCELVFS